VLGARKRGATALGGEAEQILGDPGNGAAGALLPGCVGSRVDHDPADGPPTGVV
jgi:hypothetical protein